MTKRRHPTQLEDLPEEIIDKILIRLPSKDVGRCRAVSTSWRSATSTPQFMLEHHRRQPSLPIIDGDGRPASLVVFRDTVGASNQQLWPFIPGFKHRHESSLCGACDGFLIVSRGSKFYIYNPVIRKRALLVLPQHLFLFGQSFYNPIIGFYRYHQTGEYRLLCVSQPELRSKSSLYIVTVGSDKPRHVTVTMPSVSSPSVEHKLLQKLCYSSAPPVHHRGNLHWCPYNANDITLGAGDIIVFDTEAESFRWMRTPTKLCHYWKLFNMNGTLAIWSGSACGFKGFTIMDVWVMQDYKAEIWAFKFRIDVSIVEASRQLYLSSSKKKTKTAADSAVHGFSNMAMLNDRELLIMFNETRVLRCDIDGKFLGMVKIGKSQYCMKLTQHRLQESTIPILSLELQGEDEKPPFSTGHV